MLELYFILKTMGIYWCHQISVVEKVAPTPMWSLCGTNQEQGDMYRGHSMTPRKMHDCQKYNIGSENRKKWKWIRTIMGRKESDSCMNECGGSSNKKEGPVKGDFQVFCLNTWGHTWNKEHIEMIRFRCLFCFVLGRRENWNKFRSFLYRIRHNFIPFYR